MKSLISVLVALGVCSGIFAHGQGLGVGIKAGGSLVQRNDGTKRFVLGPSLEFPLSSALAVEAAGLFRWGEAIGRCCLGRGPIIPTYPYYDTDQITTTRRRSWEFPVVLKAYYRQPRSPVFGLVGLAARRRNAEHHRETSVVVVRYGGVAEEPRVTTTRSSMSDWRGGVTLGGGFELSLGALRLQPQIRLTRWLNEPRRPLTSDALVGIDFGS